MLQRISIFQAKIGHLQLLLGKLFYFSSKVTVHFRTYVLYMMSYNNISRPVHDACDPTTRLPKIWGLRLPNPLGLTPLNASIVFEVQGILFARVWSIFVN